MARKPKSGVKPPADGGDEPQKLKLSAYAPANALIIECIVRGDIAVANLFRSSADSTPYSAGHF